MPEPRLPKENKIYRADDPNPCSGCSNCCEYVAIEIDKPRSVEDFDEIYWYLVHRDVWVYVEENGGWFVQFNTPCDKLRYRLCGIYTARPQVCRDYHPDSCVRYGDGPPEKHLFKDEKDLFEYLKSQRPRIWKKFETRVAALAGMQPKIKMKSGRKTVVSSRV